MTIAAEDVGGTAVGEVTEASPAADVEADGRIVHGTPVETILKYAEEIDTETTVIGRSGNHAYPLAGVGRQLPEFVDHEVIVG